MKKAFVLFVALFLTIPCFADTIFLKTGQKVSGKILEKTDEKVRIEVGGVPLTYWPDSIDHVSIEGEVAAQPKEEKVSVLNEDAAKLYKEAVQKIKEPPAHTGFSVDGALLDIEKNGWQDDARVISLLNDNREAIDLFKKATQQVTDGYIWGKPKDNTAYDWPQPNYVKQYFSYFPLLNLDLVEANQFLARKDIQAAQDNFLAAFRFAKHLTQQKESNSLFMVIIMIAENKLEPSVVKILEQSGFERRYYEKLLEILLIFSGEQELAQNWLAGEPNTSLAWIKYHLDYARKKGMVDSQFALDYIAFYEKELQKISDYKINAIKAKNDDIFNSNPEAIWGKQQKQKEYECKDDINADGTLTDESLQCWMKYAKEAGSDQDIKRLLWSSFEKSGKMTDCFYATIVMRNIFVTAAAIKLYKIDKGRLPDKTDDLVPEYLAQVPDDAFGNFKPLKYVQKQNGYLLYSLGPDRIDQKGEVVCDLTMIDRKNKCDMVLSVMNK